MKRLLTVVLTFSFVFFFVPNSVLAEVPENNRMQLGEISDSLPVSEMQSFYAKMEPLMREVFGPPYSNVILKIVADLEGTVHDTGYIDNEQTLILAGQARDYQKNKDTDRKHALDQIYGNMLHELSHGMFYFGTDRVTFSPQWINEGWAKLQEILLAQKLGTYNFGIKPYFNYYLDRDTIAGTTNWGSSKQVTNHPVVYDVTSVVHLTLLAAASSSNSNLDFFKTFNNYIYDWVIVNKQPNISLEQYKQIMAKLLQGKTIDGQPAYDWYFSNPNTLTQGKLGNHLGIAIDQNDVVAYVFNRTANGRDIQEIGLPDVNIIIKAVNYDGKILLEQTAKTDGDGNVRLRIPDNEKYTLMTFDAQTTIDEKVFTANMFYFPAPSDDKILSGVLVDESDKPLPAKYVGLLKSDSNFSYKNRGVFAISVPETTRIITLDFLGYKQEVTKGPLARMYAMKVPAKYIEEAAKLSDLVFEEGIIDNSNNSMKQFLNQINLKSTGFVTGIVSLMVTGVIVFIVKRQNK